MRPTACLNCASPLPPSGNAPRLFCSDRCRKVHRYSRPCPDCGAPMSGSEGLGANAPQRCAPCAAAWQHDQARWTREAVVDAIRAWERRHGEQPVSHNWNPALARRMGRPVATTFLDEPGNWPHVSTAQDVWGSWNAAIEAAGFSPRPGARLPQHLYAEIVARYEAGESSLALAADYEVTPTQILWCVRRGGGHVRSRSEAQRLRLDRERVAA